MSDLERDRRVAVTAGVAFPALVALAWPVAAPSGPWLGVAVATALLGAYTVVSLWQGAGDRGRGTLVVAAACAAAAAVHERPAPDASLICLLGIGGLVVHAFGWIAPAPLELTPSHVHRASTQAAIALLLVTAALRVADGVPFPAVAAAVAAVPLVAALEADRRRGCVSGWVAGPSFVGAVVTLASLAVPAASRPEWAVLVAAPPVIAVVFRRVDGRGLAEALFVSPARLLVVSFAATCAWGAALLAFGPAAAGRPISLADAAFTAVSATCVTGLAVRDTGSEFSGFGQLVILILIQIGGLGIMTFASAASLWTGRRMSLREEATAAHLLGPEARADLEGALALALKVTLVTELATAAALLVAFLRHGDGLPGAAWRAVFTAISAFCNAGFALQPDSLIPYRDDPLVLLPISVALIVGGLGPTVVAAAPFAMRGRVPLHVKVVFTVSALLIAVPWVLYAVLEWNASLGGLSTGSKILNAWFQAITPRTAGFNSVDLVDLRPPTWTLMCALMFVGGSPGSTAGGIKTTTLAVVVSAAIAAVRGRERAVVFGRRLPNALVQQALATTSMGLMSVVVALLALQLTQVMPLEVVLFEVVSALGTVGLTIGGTSALDNVGKVIVMVCMFAGRVGPLTLVVVLGERRAETELARPEGTFLVG